MPATAETQTLAASHRASGQSVATLFNVSHCDMSVVKYLISISAIMTLSFVLTSCDPAKLIILKNKSNKPVRLTWTIEVDSISNDSRIRRVRTSIYDLGTKKNEREATIIFGFGNWPTQEIDRYVDEDVKSIEIDGIKTNVKLTDKEEIKKYLKERRHGLFKNLITVKVY